MNYDLTDLPAGYDRGRGLDPEVIELWMEAIGAPVRGHSITLILDLGCGTGRFSQALARRFEARVIGIDPSARMLTIARAKSHDASVHHVRGCAEAIALATRSVDMVFMSMSFHHFTDRHLAARECRRVLRDHGSLFVRTGTRERIASYPYVPFFPSTRSLIETILPDIAALRAVFEGAGFRLVDSEIVTQTVARDWSAYAEKLAAGGDSVLARLSPPELEAGLARVRSHAAQESGEAVVEPIDLLIFR